MMSFILMLLLQWGTLNTTTATPATLTATKKTNQYEQPAYQRDESPRTWNVIEDDLGG